MLKALLEVTFLLRTVTWLIVMFVCLDMSRCFRDRVEEHRDIRIFFHKELKHYSISTSFLEFDLSCVDCFCLSVPYLGYWLAGNCLKPGEAFIKRYDPGKYFVLPFYLLFVGLYTFCPYDISYILLGDSSRWMEFGIQVFKFVVSRARFDHVLLWIVCGLLIGYKIILDATLDEEDSNCHYFLKSHHGNLANERGVTQF